MLITTRQHSDSAKVRQDQNITRIFSRGNIIVSCFDLKTCSKVIEDGAIGQNTNEFLLVFCSNFGPISYRFCATVNFMPKWPCRATVTSKWQWRSIWITSKMKSYSHNRLYVLWESKILPTYSGRFKGNKNLAIANRSYVSCAHNTSRASIGLITHDLEI